MDTITYRKLKSKHKDAIKLRLDLLNKLQTEHNWKEVFNRENERKIRFQRDETFFDLYYTTMTAVLFEKGESNFGDYKQVYKKIENEYQLIELFVTGGI